MSDQSLCDDQRLSDDHPLGDDPPGVDHPKVDGWHARTDRHVWPLQEDGTTVPHGGGDQPARSDRPARRYLPPGSVIPAEELETIQVAESYLAWSQERLSAAQETADALRARAAAEGYSDGVRQGRQDAAAALASVMESFRADLASLQPALAPIVIRAVEMLLGRLDRTELARACLDAALADLAAEVEVTLFVPSQDLDFFRSQVAALGTGRRTPVALEVDPLLKEGEMLLATPAGRIHVGARQQMSRLAAALAPDRSS
jgi:flagellar biosynthesis/type III secretory pathway protein FliH